ncbi:MAG: hypothetical protein KDC34_13710 [Saprospiraceae bacterium]|nr:hypothetical protein [Saprospiraceae bacterium]
MRYTYPILLALATILISSCAPSGENVNQETPALPPASTENELLTASEGDDPPHDTISFETANEYICNFQSYMANGVSLSQWNAIKADGFFIPELDVTQLVSLSGVENLRAYLGLRTDGPVDSLKLVFVGVDSNGNDMLGLITDFTSPCPPDCGNINSLIECK